VHFSKFSRELNWLRIRTPKILKEQYMKRILLPTLLMLGAHSAQASTAYGSLGNFDVVNDTGEVCHGFEIEVDDIHSSSIGGTYSYNHYGVPKIREDNSDPLHPKVFIRYEQPVSSGYTTGFTNPASPGSISPTNGHLCTNPSVNQGCEHFGVGIYSSSYTAVKYNWLIKNASGNLVKGPAVNVGTPNWTYQPPVVRPNPVPNEPPIVEFPAQVVAVIPAPVAPVPPAKKYGEPSWVKVIKTKTHKVRPLALEELVSDDKDNDGRHDWTNGEEPEVESEWKLLQTNNKGDDNKGELEGNPEDMGDHGEKIITRRYEFYAYTGGNRSIDGENGEAMCDEVNPEDNKTGVDTVTVSDALGESYDFDCSSVEVVGDYLGAQMGEFNAVAPFSMIDNIQNGRVAEGFPDRSVAYGGNSPYVTTVTQGALPNGLNIQSSTAILWGTPLKVGVFIFTVSSTDADGISASKAYSLKVTGPGDVDGDNDIDSADLAVIKSKYGQVVPAKNPADLNGDLKVNVLDYRKASSLCTKPKCALVTPEQP